MKGCLDSQPDSKIANILVEARDDEQRRLIKVRIRRVAADSGSVDASISAHRDAPGRGRA